MSREQEPESSEAECDARGHPELEDKEHWHYPDNNTHKQEDTSLLNRGESFLHQQDDLQEKKVSSAEGRDFCERVPIEEEDDISNSDSDSDDNVTIIIGSIKTNPFIFMEELTNPNAQVNKDLKTSTSGIAEMKLNVK
ncbi:testis-specific protein TSX [Fukomys damarensis]|uniref:testis-specific protein TSX n=1 Tax=Fukomys damarensis TaxID=885580 RepID=UPI00053FA801|nr:testis-specific protein TSX [Fukomys damarensis]